MAALYRGLYTLLLLPILVATQSITPSNSTDLTPASSYPRFNVTASGSVHFPNFQIAPLAQYSQISRQHFLSLRLDGLLVETTASNTNDVRSTDISFISCDPADVDGNISTAMVVNIIASMGLRNMVVLYTRTADHCDATAFADGILPKVNGIFTTLDPAVAGQIADMHPTRGDNAVAYITADPNSYTNSNAPYFNQTGDFYDSGPTTAVAMIVLYTITGIITALFVSIIVTGAVRAHRHPERYGPMRGSGAWGGQSRAKGIARAVLETIPIVKFGDPQKSNGKPEADVEMTTATPKSEGPSSGPTQEPSTTNNSETISRADPTPPTPSMSNADGTDELGVLGCSICTEEFQKGEEVRVLPCNHKYHPDCVDPWLLNVSGTCPLCRVDLRGSRVEEGQPVDPLTSYASPTHALRSALMGTREERIAALRSFRLERRNHGETTSPTNEEERRGLARRLTDRFRIRTRRYEGTDSSS